MVHPCNYITTKINALKRKYERFRRIKKTKKNNKKRVIKKAF